MRPGTAVPCGSRPRRWPGIAVDRVGRVHVTDYANNRVQILAPNGRFLEEHRGSEKHPIIKPHGVAIGPPGNVLIGHQRGLAAFRVLLPAGNELMS